MAGKLEWLNCYKKKSGKFGCASKEDWLPEKLEGTYFSNGVTRSQAHNVQGKKPTLLP